MIDFNDRFTEQMILPNDRSVRKRTNYFKNEQTNN